MTAVKVLLELAFIGSLLLASDLELGMIALRNGKSAEALHYLETARTASPRDQETLYALASCYFALGRAEEGRRTATELAAAYSADPAVLLAAGSLLLDHGAPEGAAKVLADSDALAPGNPMVLSALALAQFRIGAYDTSTASLERLAGALRRVVTPEVRNSLYRAREVALQLAGTGPAKLAAEFSLLLEEHQEGIRILEPLTASGSRSADVYGLLATLYTQAGRNADALRAARRAFELAPGRPDLVLTLAGVYQKARRNEDAIRVLKQALSRGTGTPEVLFALALSQFNFGSFAEAIANCDRALTLDAGFDRAALLKGRAYARMSRPSEAIRWLRKSLDMNARCDFCRYELATTLAANGGARESEELLGELLKTNPRNSSAHYQLGKVMVARGDNTGAIAEFEAAVASDPNYDGAYYQLGRLYAKTGDSAKANSALAVVRRIKAQRRESAEANLAAPRHP